MNSTRQAEALFGWLEPDTTIDVELDYSPVAGGEGLLVTDPIFLDLWCHRLGPTTVLLARHLALRHQQQRGQRMTVTADSLCKWFGIGLVQLARSLGRLVRFKVASFDGETLTLRMQLGVLTVPT